MNEIKHTPGPWEINKYGEVVAAGHTLRLTGVAISSKDDAEANTKLIAAAPEMLELLKQVQHIEIGYNCTGDEHVLVYDLIPELINKIEGE